METSFIETDNKILICLRDSRARDGKSINELNGALSGNAHCVANKADVEKAGDQNVNENRAFVRGARCGLAAELTRIRLAGTDPMIQKTRETGPSRGNGQ